MRKQPTSVLIAALLAAFLCLPEFVLAQGVLSNVRDDVRDNSGGSSDSHDDDDHHRRKRRKSHGHHHHHHDDCDDDGDLETLAGEIVAYLVTSPFWGPHVAVDEGFDVPGQFQTHPYDRVDGVLLVGKPASPSHITQFDVEYASDFKGLERVGAKLLWEHSDRFGFDGSANYFQEELVVGPSDSLWLGDANVVFRFAQSDHLMMRTGIGVNWLADGRGDAGFNFTYAADWFPTDPFVISAELDWGTLGDAELFHGRATIGAVFDHVELFAGYDFYDIDGTSLKGVVAGLRIWF